MAKPRLLDQARDTLRAHRYSLRTEESYLQWIKRYILFHGKRHPSDLDEQHIAAFLTHLAVEKHVAASTQNQALSAILFLYKKVLMIEPAWVNDVVRAKKPVRLPVVLSRTSLDKLLNQMDGTYQLLSRLLYGTGMRLMEAVRLRVKDIDFDYRQIIVRAGKGNKDRVTMLPETLVEDINNQLIHSRNLFDIDRDHNTPGVEKPDALDRKYPNAGKEWPWHWVFPSHRLSTDPRSRIVRRHHIYEKSLQRAIKRSANQIGLPARVTTHTLRHCFDSPPPYGSP